MLSWFSRKWSAAVFDKPDFAPLGRGFSSLGKSLHSRWRWVACSSGPSILCSTSSRVRPVETHPGKSGEYTEYPVLVCSTIIRNFFISSTPRLLRRCVPESRGLTKQVRALAPPGVLKTLGSLSLLFTGRVTPGAWGVYPRLHGACRKAVQILLTPVPLAPGDTSSGRSGHACEKYKGQDGACRSGFQRMTVALHTDRTRCGFQFSSSDSPNSGAGFTGGYHQTRQKQNVRDYSRPSPEPESVTPLSGYLDIRGISVRRGRLHAFEAKALQVDRDGLAHIFVRPLGGCGPWKHNRRGLAGKPRIQFLSARSRSGIFSSFEFRLF
jgi:hypothetical protein